MLDNLLPDTVSEPVALHASHVWYVIRFARVMKRCGWLMAPWTPVGEQDRVSGELVKFYSNGCANYCGEAWKTIGWREALVSVLWISRMYCNKKFSSNSAVTLESVPTEPHDSHVLLMRLLRKNDYVVTLRSSMGLPSFHLPSLAWIYSYIPALIRSTEACKSSPIPEMETYLSLQLTARNYSTCYS